MEDKPHYCKVEKGCTAFCHIYRLKAEVLDKLLSKSKFILES